MNPWIWYRDNFIAFEGRLARRAFVVRSLMLLGISVGFAAAGYAMFELAPPMVGVMFFFSGAALILASSLSLLVRRFHDLGRSGYTVITYYSASAAVIGAEALLEEMVGMLAATLLGLLVGALSLVILLWPGRQAPNAYGPPQI